MDIFDKFRPLAETRNALARLGGEFFTIVLEDITSPTEAVVNGRPTLLAGTNNYLGLTFDPECIRASRLAAEREGTGTTGSRLANGTFAGHIALERDLSAFFNCRHTIVFSTGYLANLAMLSTVVGPGEVILLDADCHASIYDGCRMGGADVIRFRHNDVADLEKRLRRLAKRDTNVLIVVEGLYSMLGDRAPLAEIVALKKRYGAWLAVDEAHSLGVLGAHGRGLAEEAGVAAEVDFLIGTCASNHEGLELIRYASRPYIFTASLSPSTVASVRTALRILGSRPGLREQLWDNARRLHERLRSLGFAVGPEPGPIIAVRCSTVEEAFAKWNGLLERGIYVNMVLPPATPDGGALLRCSLSAAHTREQIERIGAAFADLVDRPA